MFCEDQLETMDPGCTDPGGKDVCGGCAGVYRNRGSGPGGRKLAGGAVSRRVWICDGGVVGTDRVAGSGRKVNRL